MKFVLITLLACVTFVYTNNINDEDMIDLENNTAYDYHRKIGIPLAEKIRAIESQQLGSRIVGGNNSSLGQFPYQAGLLLNFTIGQGVCGGCIVNPHRVLTAAHCWFDGVNQASDITVVTGTVGLFFGGQRTWTNDVVMHPDWTPQMIRNDIAVIRLPSFLQFSNNVAAITLPRGNLLNENFVGLIGTASGFGRTANNAPVTPQQVLSHVELPVISNEECLFTYPAHVVPSNICTSGAGGRNVCGADSGGPLAVIWNARPLLVGVTSFGSPAGCDAGQPSAYARVSYFMSWLEHQLV